ncbi:MAG: tetratricopeptide repeat protein [Chitinophagaceae bacterium]|nr:tetratricopeptide repeat protein [Chitinophagaceae bacterium]
MIPAFVMAQKDPTWGYVTDKQADRLKRSVQTEKNDTLKMAAYRSLGFYYQDFIPDSGLYFHEQQLVLSKKLNRRLWQADAYSQAAYVLALSGDVIKSYDYFNEAIKLASDEKSESDKWRPWTFSNSENSHDARIAILGMNYQMMANLWGYLGETEKRISTSREALKLGESINNGKILHLAYTNLGIGAPPDSALLFFNKSLQKAAAAGYMRIGNTLLNMAGVYAKKGLWDSAFNYAYKSIAMSQENNYLRALVTSYNAISQLFSRQNNKDSSLFYANKALEAARISGISSGLQSAYRSLSAAYAITNKTDSAFKYEQLSNLLNDSLKNVRIANLTNYQKFSFNEQLRLKKMDEEKTAYANNLKMIGLIVVLGGILLTTIILYRNNRQKQKANKVLETTLTNLKSTQSQLIQSEKMASLGELTAGIAHEIQNPLNFVNNFSEVNKELLVEMKDELKKGNIEEVNSLADDVIDNEDKIIFHGKRADAIVKGMLQHSRSSSGVKEPTDINALCDEYLRLSYHGLRAKDKSFNATMKTDFDTSIRDINIIPQDIGRVILNLLTNAFYAVNEKQKQNIAGYEPTVTIKTAQNPLSGDRGAEIRVSDNGNGIPQKVLDKIFQPFFTTKPTGQGTGLGLSLSYDIIKAHGGELKVETKENEGSVFSIILPITNA